MTLRRSAAATAALLSALMAGCAPMIPAYQRVTPPVPASYPVADTGQGRPATEIDWREFFADARLRAVIAQALANNRDLRVAVLNIEQARAQYRIQESQLFPTVNVGAGATIQRTPRSLVGSTTTAATGTDVVNATGGITTRSYSATVGVSAYELDLFGRVRSLNREALESFLATGEARRATQLSLVAEVATSYLQWAADIEQLALSERTLASQSEALQLTQRRVDLGAATDLTLRQQQIIVETARSDVALYRGQIVRDRNALVLLAGSDLPPDVEPLALGTGINALPPLPAGLPSDVLLRRPDVQQAEHTLLAANADIGAARAAFYPRIALTGDAGTGSTQLSGLFKSGTFLWSFIPQITLPIFDGGYNRANLDYSIVTRDIRVAQYEKTIQSAFREVADALATRVNISAQIDAQRALVGAASGALTLSDARFTRGVDSFLNVLDAQRTLYQSQQQLIQTQLQQLSNDVTLYRALGGGWSGDEPVAAADAGR